MPTIDNSAVDEDERVGSEGGIIAVPASTTTTLNPLDTTVMAVTDPATIGTITAAAAAVDDAPPPIDQSDLFLDRLRHNATMYPNKRAMAFVVSSSLVTATTAGAAASTASSSTLSRVKIETEISYAELDDVTNRLAISLLDDHSIQKGDRVVLVYPPSLNFTIAFIACIKAGIIAVPVFPPNPVRRDSIQMFAVIVKACNATVALTDTTYQHQKKLGRIRDTFQKFTLPRQHSASSSSNGLSWPESLVWITTDNTKSNSPNNSDVAVGIQSRLRPVQDDNMTTTYRNEIAFLQFTSGSTSDPKGVMITHGNMAHNLYCITQELHAADDTIVVSWLPQYHDMGLIGSVLGCIYCGGTGYYMSPITFLQRPMTWIEAISKYKGTHLQAPNFAYKLTARKYHEAYPNASISSNIANNNKVQDGPILDLSSVRHAINAAEPVDIDSIAMFYSAFKRFGLKDVIYPTYGLAEHTVFVCSGGKQVLQVQKQELEVNRRVVVVASGTVVDSSTITNKNNNGDNNEITTSIMVGCGYPATQGIDVQIVTYSENDDLDTSVTTTTYNKLEAARTGVAVVGEDMVGEIWVRSPSKAAGYYGKAKETIEDFHAQLQHHGGGWYGSNRDDTDSDGDGYLRTGDLGFMHNSELFICGRLKDLIIIGGRNYYPQDIESTAESSDQLIRLGCSAAFTIDPTRHGEEEIALILELKDVPASKDVARICDALANHIRSIINQDHSIGIGTITFLKPRTVPKTSSGKIARAWCRKAYVAGHLNIIYQKSFKNEMSPLEIEHGTGIKPHLSQSDGQQLTSNDAVSIRAMSKDNILKMLVTDVARVANMNINIVDKNASLIHMLDSLSITQFKGMLENNYAVKLSDEYLFRETTTITKLVDVVKLGYAPDDIDGTNTSAAMAGTTAASIPGQAKGLAGALGCPPGVVCVIM